LADQIELGEGGIEQGHGWDSGKSTSVPLPWDGLSAGPPE
jgi:hypothetical protein